VVGGMGARARERSLSLSLALSRTLFLSGRQPPPPKPACRPPNVAVSSSGVGVVTPRRFRGKNIVRTRGPPTPPFGRRKNRNP